MRNLRSIVNSYGNKMQGGTCCNGNPLMKEWMSGGGAGNQEPCCGDLSRHQPIFGEFYSETNEVISSDYTFEIDCPIEVCFVYRINNAGMGDTNTLLYLINGIENEFNSSTECIVVNNGNTLSFRLRSTEASADYCHDVEIDIVNNTCGIQYTNAVKLSVNHDPNCTFCPFIIPSIITDQYRFSVGIFTNTFSNNITYDFVNVVPNFQNDCFDLGVWINRNPLDYPNDPDYFLIQDGVFISTSIILLPGQTMTIYASIDESCEIKTDYTINYNFMNDNCSINIPSSFNINAK